MFCSLLYLCFYSSLFFQFKNILPKDIFWNSCQIINRDSTSDIKWELVLHFNTKTHKSLLSLRISTDCLLNFHRDTSPNRYKSQVKKKYLGKKHTKKVNPYLILQQAQLLLIIMFVSFIQCQIWSILQGNKSVPQTYTASIAQQKVRYKGEVDLFIMKKTVENQKKCHWDTYRTVQNLLRL